jgi:hypothetical protein
MDENPFAPSQIETFVSSNASAEKQNPMLLAGTAKLKSKIVGAKWGARSGGIVFDSSECLRNDANGCCHS